MELELQQQIARLCGSEVVSSRPINRGYTVALRYVVQLKNGDSVFVKVATEDLTAQWLRSEGAIYQKLHAPFMAGFVAFEDGVRPILILEDLSSFCWPPPWNDSYIARMFDLLGRLRKNDVPHGIQPLTNFAEELKGWQRIAENPESFLTLGMVTEPWLTQSLPALIDAETRVVLEGDALVHTDIRSDNVCFADDRTVLVDWNWAARGNPAFDTVLWLPSLYIEGGPAPWSFDVDEPEMIAALAGFYAFHAGQPETFAGAKEIRALQRKLLDGFLPWCVRVLDLPQMH